MYTIVAFIQVRHSRGDCLRFVSSYKKVEGEITGFYLDVSLGYFSGSNLQYIDPLSNRIFLIHSAGRHTLKQELRAKLQLKKLLPDILQTLEKQLSLAPFTDETLSRLRYLLTDVTKQCGVAKYRPVLPAAVR